MNSNYALLDCLDFFVRSIARVSILAPKTGLLTGKIGLAILLYNYSRYRNDPEIAKYADNLTDIDVRNINFESIKGLDEGLCGFAWGINYLIKNGFVQADEDIFKEIEFFLFKKGNRAMEINDLRGETDTGLYVWERFNSCKPFEINKWEKRMEDCMNNFRIIIMQKYTSYEYPFYSCKFLIRFFYICRTLLEKGQYCPEIYELFKELPEIVNISYKEEKRISDKYILALLLEGIPGFEGYKPVDEALQSMTLADIGNFYITLFILDGNIIIPEIVNKTIVSLAKDHQYTTEILSQLKPENAGLENYISGLAWAMLQLCMKRDEKFGQ